MCFWALPHFYWSYLLYLDRVMMNSTLQSNVLQRVTLIARTNHSNLGNQLLNVVYAILIPLIITTNVIFGIIKLKRNKFTSSQILFLTLFSSDLTFGVVQLPTQIYILWKPTNLFWNPARGIFHGIFYMYVR